MTEKYVLEVNTDYETGEEHCTVLKTDETTNIDNWIGIVSTMYTHHSILEPLVDELNKLHNKNEVLIQGILMKEEIINDLKDDIKKCNIQCRKLGNENEQLKRENELLSDELEQCKAVINIRWKEYLNKKGDVE